MTITMVSIWFRSLRVISLLPCVQTVSLVSFDPVVSNLLLRILQRDAASTDLSMQKVFQLVLLAGIRRTIEGLRPKVFNCIAPSEFQCNQMVNLARAGGLIRRHVVATIHLVLH